MNQLFFPAEDARLFNVFVVIDWLLVHKYEQPWGNISFSHT